MFIHVPNPRIGADSNRYVISMYQKALKGWEPPSEVSCELYAKVRSDRDKYPPWLVGFLGFGCSYAANFFAGYARNSQGTNYAERTKRNLLREVKLMEGATLIWCDYRELAIPPGSIIYCDPPYRGAHVSYSRGFDHDAFWEWCRKRAREGSKVFVSEYQAPEDFTCILTIPSAVLVIKPYRETEEKLFVYTG